MFVYDMQCDKTDMNLCGPDIIFLLNLFSIIISQSFSAHVRWEILQRSGLNLEIFKAPRL